MNALLVLSLDVGTASRVLLQDLRMSVCVVYVLYQHKSSQMCAGTNGLYARCLKLEISFVWLFTNETLKI